LCCRAGSRRPTPTAHGGKEEQPQTGNVFYSVWQRDMPDYHEAWRTVFGDASTEKAPLVEKPADSRRRSGSPSNIASA
jgi:hypothetical protein